MNRYLLSIIGITLLFGMLVTACGSKTDGPEIMVENAWGRPSPKIATAGAFYMLINNDGNEGDNEHRHYLIPAPFTHKNLR